MSENIEKPQLSNPLAQVRIILVEPAGPLNVGSIARSMKNMGLKDLVLVNPKCDRLCAEARQMAVHAVDILETAIEVATMPEALQGCNRAIATTARSRALPTELEHPRTALPWLLEPGVTSALIFGSEERGLSNIELNYAQRFVGIPANPEYPSLNLAQAVTICCYELYQAINFIPSAAPVSLPPTSNTPSEIASLDVLEEYYQHLQAVLLQIGYIYPHTANSRMEKMRRIYNRASLTKTEITMLRGILRQTEWAVIAKVKS